jgi:hypothetical protein
MRGCSINSVESLFLNGYGSAEFGEVYAPVNRAVLAAGLPTMA